MGRDEETSGIRMPNARISLSHAGDTAVAVATRRPRSGGVGVDIEALRPIPPDAARFFLRSTEHALLDKMDARTRAVDTLRLWTVKEAVFKADLGNAGAQLADYALDHTDKWAGSARRADRPGVEIDYCSVRIPAHIVTVARRRNHDVTT
jgi:phosphopantetheinyl transferase